LLKEEAMQRALGIGVAIFSVGLVLTLLSVLAGVVGIGEGSALGWKQAIGLGVGAALLGAGIATAWLAMSWSGSPRERR
jgi:hypothetical protein